MLRLLAPANPIRLLARRGKRKAIAIRASLRDRFRGETAETFFDLRNAAEVNAELAAHGAEPLEVNPADADAGVRGAARYILATLVCNRAIRRHYPQALSGANAGFIAFLQEAVSPQGAANIAACFAAPPGELTRRIFLIRRDLREAFPLALTPRQRRPFFAWLLVHGSKDFGVTPEAALWHLIEIDETPDRGLIPTYLMQPQWQQVQPLGLTHFGWLDFVQYVRRTYDIQGRWLRGVKWRPTLRPWDELALLRQEWPQLFRDFPAADHRAIPAWLARCFGVRNLQPEWLAGLAEDYAAGLPQQIGVNVFGHYRYISGLQEAVAGVVKAVQAQGVRTALRELSVTLRDDCRDRADYQNLEIFDTSIYVSAVNTFASKNYHYAGLRMRPGVRHIGVWYWEVERLPEEWVSEMAWADEIWAPTRFIAEAYRKHVRVPVLPMLPGLALPRFERQPRRNFDLPEDHFLTLFCFDMGSVMQRKNPLGLIEAWRRAFRGDDRAHLCIKVSQGETNRKNLAALEEACRSVGATLIARTMSRPDVLALLASADCYASLHRAEGLGLGLAESMLLGTPVIGTAYSGNLDFMNASNSFLVDAGMTPIGDAPPYPADGFWAEPDLDHAALLLRQIYQDREMAKAVAERGRRDVAELLSLEAAGQRMMQRLRQLQAQPLKAAA